jgi:hexosaminidase
MKKLFLCLLTLLICKASLNAQVNVIPQPLEVNILSAAKFNLTDKTPIIFQAEGLKKSASFLNGYLSQFYGFSLAQSKVKSKRGIYLMLNDKASKVPGNYSLEVKNDGIFITSSTEEGVFYGMQTLIQLLDPKKKDKNVNIPFVQIRDEPRFQYRSMHLDVSRHFSTVAYVKKYIDYLALHKMNYFHWHLTDDQGWRIEIKKYPQLTEVGSKRKGTITGFLPGNGNTNKPHGGFYTQDEIRDVIKYAAERYITVIPEIEMPGHASAALTAYKHLGCTGGPYKVQETWGVFDEIFCAGNEQTFTFLQDVIDEVITLFPSRYIHVGGDECPKTSWKKCEKCQQRMKDNKLKDEHELQSYFVQRMEKYINSKGKSIIGWDEILEGGLAPNATVMSWRGEAGGIAAAKLNHYAIMTPGTHVYLDYAPSANRDSLMMPGTTTVEKVYSYEPIPAELPLDQQKYILGAQGNVWTEYMNSPSKIEYMIFPRMSALSEVVWSSKKNKDWNSFQKRLKSQQERYKLWGANYFKEAETE